MGILKMDTKRAFFNIKFLVLIIATAALWYMNTRRFMREEDVLAIFFAAVGRSTITYISPAVCSAVYSLSVCEEFQNNEIRNILCRVSLKKYVISKVFVCMMGTIVAYFLGTMCYILFELTQHPLVSANSMAVENLREITSFHVLLPEYTLGFIALQILLNGICCGCMAVIALGISPYIRDGFLVLCFPSVLFFLLLFVSGTLLNLPTNTESMFWIILTTQSCSAFLLTDIIYMICFCGISTWLLYKGIMRYEYE